MERLDPAEVDVMAEDIFYKRLLGFWILRNFKVMVMEVGGDKQALRVVEMAKKMGIGNLSGEVIEIWRDWVDTHHSSAGYEPMATAGCEIKVKGEGHMRSVVLINESVSPW